MSDPISEPGERRLAHPPSDRYRAAEAPTTAAADARPLRTTSRGLGLAYAAIATILGAVAIVVVGGVLTLTGGLLVVAVVIGLATGRALKVGAGETIPTGRRAWIAAGLALGAVVAGQIGLWLYADYEGGVLPLVEYLAEVFGPLVLLQAVIAPSVAWVSAR